MSSEHVSPGQGEAQQTTRKDTNIRQPMTLVAAGAFAAESSFSQVTREEIAPSLYQASLDGTAAGQPPVLRGGEPQTQDDKDPKKRNIVQAAAVATGVTGLLGGAALIYASVFGGNKPKDPDSNTGGGGEITQIVPSATREAPKNTPVPTETPAPTEIPRKYPEKYNFGENDKYFRPYLDGKIWTGVEADRAEEAAVTFTWFRNNEEMTKDNVSYSSIEIVDPESLERAVIIASSLKNDLANYENGKITSNDVIAMKNKIISDIESGESTGIEKKVGIVFVQVPSNQVFTSSDVGYGMFEDEQNIVYEIFSPTVTTQTPEYMWGYVLEAISLDAMGVLGLAEPFLVDPDSQFRKDLNNIEIGMLQVLPKDSIKLNQQ